MRNLSFLPAAVWTLVIAVACLISSDEIEKVNFADIKYNDKFLHALFYFLFTIFWFQFLRAFLKNADVRKIRIYVFLLALLYGSIIEICQATFSSGRSGDILDVVANSTGSALAILALWLFKRNKTQKYDPLT